MPHPQLTELIFPQASKDPSSQIHSAARRAKNSPRNRLRSIRSDAAFVQLVATALDLPLVANERCGSWYVGPASKAASAYFKSTDGHHGRWAFSARRLNLHVLDVVQRHQGCIIVDSTRRGKPMPDALSKTVPVWIAVLNRALFPEREDAHGVVPNPDPDPDPGPNSDSDDTLADSRRINALLSRSPVPASELAQIQALLPAFACTLSGLGLPLADLRARLSAPLKPIFLTQGTYHRLLSSSSDSDSGRSIRDLLSSLASDPCRPFLPLVLLTASRSQPSSSFLSHHPISSDDDEREDGWYIQGAGDDTETWARGLTAEAFWRNAEYLGAADGDEELEERISEVMSREKKGRAGDERAVFPLKGRRGAAFWVGSLGGRDFSPHPSSSNGDGDEEGGGEWDGVIICHAPADANQDPDQDQDGNGNAGTQRTGLGTGPEGFTDASKARPDDSTKTPPDPSDEHPLILNLNLPRTKHASKLLRSRLSLLTPFLAALLARRHHRNNNDGQQQQQQQSHPKLLVACDTGADLSVGVALAMLCLHYDCYDDDDDNDDENDGKNDNNGDRDGERKERDAREKGNITARPRDRQSIDKPFVRRRLASLMAQLQGSANPSRATLQSVNAFLMGRPD